MRRLTIALFLLAPLAARAQANGPTVAAPQLSASATAEVQLKPDRATLSFTVESRGATAAKAGAETSRKQRAVIDTLRALGVAADQMTTASIQINPEIAYTEKPPRVTGYVARNTLRVEVREIEKTGLLIDAALASEATGIGSLVFSASRADEARRQALELAVAKAKGEAESMAKAAGGALGGLIELSAQPSYQQPIAVDMAMRSSQFGAAAAPMPIEAGLLRVSATVSGRWGFLK